MATPAIIDKLQKIPAKTRMYVFFGILVAAVFAFVYFVHMPKSNEIKKLDAEIVELQAKIAENNAKIAKLDQLRAEVKSLEARLKILTEQLPPENEVSGLLRSIQGLVNKAGLTLKLWKPDKRRPHSSGLYEEIPINMELVGGYHNVAVFFDSVSKLTRIVNMLNVKMEQAKPGAGNAMDITIKTIGMTFAAVEKKAAPSTPPTATKQVK